MKARNPKAKITPEEKDAEETSSTHSEKGPRTVHANQIHQDMTGTIIYMNTPKARYTVHALCAKSVQMIKSV